MKFGVREICDVVFKAKADTKIGTSTFKKGQPVLYIDTAKTSTIEGAATTVYATGGKGNTRLIAWEGEKTLTFTVEDALLSPIGFSVLSGAGLFKSATDTVHVHTTANAYVGNDGTIDLTDSLETAEQIDAGNFAGYYYVEASTLFRRESDGVDMPAEITLPNVKIQSNFTFSMASTGDPSTFTFTMDAFPGYTYFDRTKKVLCVMQVVEDATAGTETRNSVMKHQSGFVIPEAAEGNDSTAAGGENS